MKVASRLKENVKNGESHHCEMRCCPYEAISDDCSDLADEGCNYYTNDERRIFRKYEQRVIKISIHNSQTRTYCSPRGHINRVSSFVLLYCPCNEKQKVSTYWSMLGHATQTSYHMQNYG